MLVSVRVLGFQVFAVNMVSVGMLMMLMRMPLVVMWRMGNIRYRLVVRDHIHLRPRQAAAAYFAHLQTRAYIQRCCRLFEQ